MQSPSPVIQNAWFLTGPTAAGKTAVGIELARRLSAEIISMDSMALYRGMDIGTAKPSTADRTVVPHHLIDIIGPSAEFSVAQYLAVAESAAHDIASRGRQVLFVGGTALYLKALLRGLFSGPPADWKLRRELEEVARIEGSTSLHRRLQAVDSAAATKLHANDVRRIIRALEVHQSTGQPISSLQRQFERGRSADQCRVFVLDWPREQLEERIRRRVDYMFADGLVDEAKRLTSPSLQPDPARKEEETLSRTASQAVGYREVLEYLSGKRELPATIELVKLRTRQFAKRQLTWLRSLSECRWLHVAQPIDPSEVAQRIALTAETNLSRMSQSN